MCKSPIIIRLLFFVLFGTCSVSSAGGLGAGVTAGNAFLRAQEEQREFDRQQQRHEREMERMRLENEIQKRQIENSRREAAENEQTKERAQEAARAAVQAAIDQIPILKNWQKNDPARWNRAREVDTIMRQLPENADLSLFERFTKVVRYVEVEFQANKAP